LEKFNKILDITINGDYEAHSVDGKLKAHVGTFDNTGIAYVTLPNVDDVHMYTNCKIMNRYVGLFTEPLEVQTSENAILLYNDNLEILLPMVAEENAKKSTKFLKQEVLYEDALVIKIQMDRLKSIIAGSKVQDNAIFKFIMDKYLIIENDKLKHKFNAIVGPKPFTWGFKRDVIERILIQSGSDVTFTLAYNTKMPVKIQYTAGQIIVEAYVMGFNLDEEIKE